ncbi:MAG: trigger factor [Acidobacteriota bacterium]|nr:trigger factor [Acidobacteriota bacterium]MDW3228630.1 trigger factor [Acidobacteriota bacterium]MDY0232236.1 trigger factor [Candidatus Saccharicenans sp.]
MEKTLNQEKLKLVSPTVRELNLEIPAGEVQKEYEKVLKDYLKKVKLPGFRKGYAPREMVQRMFEAEIKETVLDNLIPENLGQELKSLQVSPVNIPSVKSIEFDLEKGIKYQVSFEVWPDFELPSDYLDRKIEAEKTEVDEKEIEAVLNNIRENAAEYLPVTDRGVQAGDYVVVEIQGRDLKSKNIMPLEKIVVLAGHPENEPKLNEVLPEMKPGEEKSFLVQYPADYQQKKFAGKEIEYRIKVLEIKEKKLPELDDEFARAVSEVSGLEALKNKIYQDLIEQKERQSEDRALNLYLENLAAEINLVVPESIVAEEAQATIQRQFKEEELKKIPQDLWPRLQEQARKQAENRLKNNILLQKIAEKEGLSITEEEFEEELKKISAAQNIPLNQLRSVLSRENKEAEWRLNLRLRKTVDFLGEKVIIK